MGEQGAGSGTSRWRFARRLVQPAIVALGLVPAARLVADALRDRLGANPIEAITHTTGDWTLYLLLATLAVTPLRRVPRLHGLIRCRRTLGLLAFTYACLHLLTYAVLDQGLALRYVGEDIAKRPYITVGFAAFLLLLPLAVTSTRNWIRRLGGRRWNALHRLVYVAGAGAILHYLWLVKGDRWTPVYYGIVLIGLLALRLRRGWTRSVTPSRVRPRPASPVLVHHLSPPPPAALAVRDPLP